LEAAEELWGGTFFSFAFVWGLWVRWKICEIGRGYAIVGMWHTPSRDGIEYVGDAFCAQALVESCMYIPFILHLVLSMMSHNAPQCEPNDKPPAAIRRSDRLDKGNDV
jgi:hypothetical protein